MDSSSSCHVCVIESVSSERLYVGCTKNLTERITRHNKGYVKSTRKHVPYKLLDCEEHSSLGSARKRELQLKSFKKPSYLRKYVLRAVSSVGRAPDF